MKGIPVRLVGEAAFKSLTPELRRLYREVEPDAEGNTIFALNLNTGKDFELLVNHSEFGPLARAYRRNKEEADELKSKLAELESTPRVRTSDVELWDRRHEILAHDDIEQLKVRLAQELQDNEDKNAAELAKLESKRKAMEARLNATEQCDALTGALRKAGVKPEFEKAIIALLKPGMMQVGDRPMMQTDFGMMALDDYVQRWASSEEGEAYVKLDAPRRSIGKQRAGGFLEQVRRMR